MPAQREALHRLLDLVRDRSADLRARGHAVKCVSRAQDPGVAAALLDVLRSDDDNQVRCFAATALGHHRRPEVVEALIAVARVPQEGFWVRTNSLLALVRLDLPEATGFLVRLLDAGAGERDLWTPEASSILREVHTSSNMELVRACLRYVRRRLGSSQIAGQGLELCAARACMEGEELCREILGSTQNLRLARPFRSNRRRNGCRGSSSCSRPRRTAGTCRRTPRPRAWCSRCAACAVPRSRIFCWG